ncbi:MAG: hypothetical protein ACI9Y1_001003 [Lentisphaeria bacterium]|jgi:hypothetical protein
MSKLIRDQELSTADQYVTPLLPLSQSVIVTHLKACQQVASGRSAEVFEGFMAALDKTFGIEAKKARSNQEAAELTELQRVLRENSKELERYYCGYLSEGFVKFKKHQLNTTVGSDLGQSGEKLSLVGNEDLEEAIAITSLTQRADAYFAEPLWALNQRFAVLNGGEYVTEATNPAAPIQLCESLRKALKFIPLNSKAKLLVYKTYDLLLLDLTGNITEGINQYLKSQGILPHLRYTLPSVSVPVSYLSDEHSEAQAAPHFDAAEGPDPNLSPEEYQGELLNAIRNLQNQLVLDVAVSPPKDAVVVSEADLLSALQILQHDAEGLTSNTAFSQPLTPIDISSIIEQLTQQLQSENEDNVVANNDMQTIDLVGMLFDYMLSDENLPDRIKALLSYLHTPFLKIAFIDPGFFEKPDHPARLLLNSLAEAGIRWVGNDGTDQYDIHHKISDTVNRILKDFDSDIKVITALLLDFNSTTKNIIRRQELMEKRATEKAQGEEKLREVKLRVNDEIRGRTQNRELPSAVLLFLLQPWTDYLSFALLRYGDQSEKWHKALGLVDDLLWCINPNVKDAEKSRQFEVHDSILVRIASGFETIGFDQVKGKKLVEAITSLIKLAMQSKKAEPAPAPMRDKLERIAAEKAGPRPANNDASTPEEAQVLDSLKMIEFGTWFEFQGGKRLKVAWYNARTSHYMLVDQMGKRVDMMSGLDLSRQMIAGTAKIISGSSKPFFERALENIFQKLNEKAEANKRFGEGDA